MKSRILLAAAVAALIGTSASAATPAAPAAVVSPWSKVPAAPTACYSSQDHYNEQNSAAVDAVNNESDSIAERNGALDQQANDILAANPMAMAQAMQEAMMSDPQNAQKYMERMMQQGQDAQAAVPAQMEREKQLLAEKDSVIKQYHAALAAANGPANARWTALKKRYGLPADAPGPGESGVPDWVWAEWGVILHERDSAYQATCATWFAPAGALQSYLKRYKTFLVAERIPYEKKLEEPKLEQYRTLGVPTATYRSTAEHKAVADYLRMARDIFDERRDRPYCGADGRCE
jgi:hypothetical protein